MSGRATSSGVAGILIAAGASRRFGGTDKLLATIGETSVLARTARALAASRAGCVYAVTGRDDAVRRRALAGLDAVDVINPRPQDGQGSSIARGVAALPETFAGALIVPGDMPLLTPQLIDRLIAEFLEWRSAMIIYPAAEGAQRAPVLWPRDFFPALAALDGDRGGKQILTSHARFVRAVAIAPAEAHCLDDVDTPGDLARIAARIADAGAEAKANAGTASVRAAGHRGL